MTPPSTLNLIRWLTAITRPVHAPLLASALLRVINLSLELVIFGLAGWTVSAAVMGKPVAGLMLWILVAAVAKALAYYLEQFSGHYVAFKALELLRGHAFSALWPKAPAVVLRNRSGDLLPTLTRDVDRIEVVYAHTFAPVVSALLVPTGALVVTGFVVGWQIVVIPAVCVLLALTVVPFVGLRSSLRRTGDGLRLRRDLAAHITDSVYGAEEVLSYGRLADRVAEQDQLGAKIRDAAKPPLAVKAFRRGANLGLTLVTAAAIVGVGVGSGFDPILVATLAAASLRLFEGPRGVEDAVGYLDHSLSAARRLWELTHLPEAVSDGTRILAPAAAPQIEWRQVSYRYPETPPEKHSLDEVSITAAAGKRTVFIGRSGSGKSTAAQLLLRFDELGAGEIYIDGVPAREYTLDSLRRTIALVPQRGQVLDASIAENLRLGAPDATDDELWAALQVAELAAEIAAMPKELDTATGRDGKELSGGQLQRLCLARALLTQPKVLVLDEFTANLNQEIETRIRANLEHTYPELTVIEITHRLEHIGDAHQVVTFDDGRVIDTQCPSGRTEASTS